MTQTEELYECCKCGADVSDLNNFCPFCGNDVRDLEDGDVPESNVTPTSTGPSLRKFVGILVFVLGFISGLMFFNGGSMLSAAGAELTALQSVSGTSVAEKYYQTMGQFGLAYSSISNAVGLAIIALSAGLGGLLFFGGADDDSTTETPSKAMT